MRLLAALLLLCGVSFAAETFYEVQPALWYKITVMHPRNAPGNVEYVMVSIWYDDNTEDSFNCLIHYQDRNGVEQTKTLTLTRKMGAYFWGYEIIESSRLIDITVGGNPGYEDAPVIIECEPPTS